MPTRRQFLSLLAAAPLAAAPRIVRAEGKVVLLLGSSMMKGGFGIYLAKNLADTHGCTTENRAKTSTGLARPDFYDWVEHGREFREQTNADIVIVHFGGNDGQGLWMGSDHDPPWHRYGEPGWVPEYRRRVNFFADAVAPDRQRLFWIGMPQVESDKLNARVEVMNSVYASETALRPNARFVPLWDAMTKNGHYADRIVINGVRTKVRAPDGIHPNPAGARYLADYVQPFIDEAF